MIPMFPVWTWNETRRLLDDLRVSSVGDNGIKNETADVHKRTCTFRSEWFVECKVNVFEVFFAYVYR